MFSRNPFGFSSKRRGQKFKTKDHNIELISSGGVGYVSLNEVKKNQEYIDKYKVTIGKVVPSNGEVDVTPEIGYKVTTTNRILYPGQIHTESYMLLSIFEQEEYAINFSFFMKQKFPRFLLKQSLSSMNISRANFDFVPKLDWTKKWDDESLFNYFNLSREEADYVSNIIREME